ncbi:MAG TPA: RNA methyltransferase [Thermoanaerobaculia bacterium]|nr:RNA methyltransferase [Thermoanaerobaculia bacterium]
MKSISSRQNPLFKRISAAIRKHDDEIAIEGPKPVADAIACGWKPIAIIERGGQAIPPVPDRQAGLPVVHFTPELFDALAETKSPQNVIGLFERPRASAADILERRETVAIALDAVQDPGNVGTIVRLAAAFDAAGVLLLPGCADPFGPKAIRSSVGAILNVPVAPITMEELLGRNLVAADMSGAATDPPSRDAVFVFGNEGSGVSAELMRAATTLAIPMSARVESLNVASSAAILLARSFALRS